MTASHTCPGDVVGADAVTAGDPLEHAADTTIPQRSRTDPSRPTILPSDGDNPAPSRERRHHRAEPSEFGLGVGAGGDRDQNGPHTGATDRRLAPRIGDARGGT